MVSLCRRILTFVFAGADVIISVLVTFVQDSESLTELNPAQFRKAKYYFVILGLQFVFWTRALAVTKDCSLNTTLDALKSPLESEFSSPHFLNGFPVNKSCGWYIKAPENHIIELQFKEPWINFDNVHVFDVFDKDGTECSLINLPRFYPKVVSRSQIVFISFKNDKTYKISYKAFKPGRFCSAKNSIQENQNILLTNPSGVMKTPGFPKDYTSASVRDCFWKIIAPRGHLVRLEFITFQIHINDRVKISYDWNWWYPWYIYRLTPWHSFTVYSTGRQLGVQLFGHDEVDHSVGFLANYTMVPAGDFSGTCDLSKNTTVRMRGEGRSFSSPRYPLNPGEGQCTWDISVPQGEYLKLTFWKFEGTCDQNYVEVYDATNASIKLLTKSCQATLFNQQVLYSIGNHLLLRLLSVTSSNRSGGFMATYEAVKDVPAPYSCFDSVELRLDQNGSDFASFDFPLPYPNNAKCSWLITAPIGHVVQLEFHSFALQESRGCRADYVEVKEGFAEATPTLIGRFCGKSLPLVVQSKYPKMYVDFVSDILERYPGFHARYYFVPDPAVGPCNQDGVDNIIPLSGATGQIFSPRYPRLPPPRNISCTWIITVPQGQFVKLRVNRLEQDSGCSLLSIRDGRDLSSHLVKSFCEWDIVGLPRSYFSSGRYLLVHFYSPSLYWWFEAEFEAINQLPAICSCTRKDLSGELTSNSGTLASYNYPLSYNEQISCSWKITAGLLKRIVLSFDAFNLSDPSPECLDYVQIGEEKMDYNRGSTTKFCGSMKPAPVTSSGGELYVWFFASGKTKHPGFKASYETEVSPLGVGVIVACCLGGTLVFIIIGNIGFKYFKSRRKRGSGDRNRGREDLHELCLEESL